MDTKRLICLLFGLFCITAIVLACIFMHINGAIIKSAFTLLGVVIGMAFNIVPAAWKSTKKE